MRPSRQYISIHIVLGCAADRLGKVHESLTRRFRSHAGMTERVHGPDETLGGICHPSDLRRSCSGTLSHRSVQRGGRREALRLGRVRSLLLQFRSPGRTNYYRHEARDCPAVRSRMRPRAPSVAYSYLSLVPYLKRAEDMGLEARAIPNGAIGTETGPRGAGLKRSVYIGLVSGSQVNGGQSGQTEGTPRPSIELGTPIPAGMVRYLICATALACHTQTRRPLLHICPWRTPDW